jgi:hypothetical protein
MGNNSNNNPYDSDATKYCKIYDQNDWFTMIVQIVLALCCVAALWYKRLTEIPRRTFHTWFMDVFKQAAGACYAHVLNMVSREIDSRPTLYTHTHFTAASSTQTCVQVLYILLFGLAGFKNQNSHTRTKYLSLSLLFILFRHTHSFLFCFWTTLAHRSLRPCYRKVSVTTLKIP